MIIFALCHPEVWAIGLKDPLFQDRGRHWKGFEAHLPKPSAFRCSWSQPVEACTFIIVFFTLGFTADIGMWFAAALLVNPHVVVAMVFLCFFIRYCSPNFHLVNHCSFLVYCSLWWLSENGYMDLSEASNGIFNWRREDIQTKVPRRQHYSSSLPGPTKRESLNILAYWIWTCPIYAHNSSF